MPRLTPVSWKKLICVFKKAGFVLDRKSGDHHVYVKDGILRPLIIPAYPEIDVHIIQSLIKTAKLTREEYFRFLAQC